jgi:small-conductance mechanosensitive channel
MLTRSLGLLSLLLAVGVITTPSPLSAQVPAAPAEEFETAAVELDGSVLFRVRGISSYPAEARARLVRDRIAAAAADATVTIDSVRTVQSDGAIRIQAGDRLIVPIVDADAAIERISRADLAAAYLVRVRQAIADYRSARSPAALRRAAASTLAATVLLALTVIVVVWFWRRLDERLTGHLQARIHTVGIQSFEVMRADRIWQALRSGLFGLRTLVFLAAGLVYVGYVLARWPWTRGLSQDIVGFALSPLKVIGGGILANIPSLIFLTVLFFVLRFSLKLLRLFFEAVERRTVTLSGFDAEWAQPTYKIIRVAVVAFGLIVAYPYIPGSQSAAFKGVSLFIGIIFSLGSSSAISNIVAGYMMTYRRAFRVGDRVKIGDATGDVIEMRLQVTHLRSYKNEEIVIPNSQILTSEVLNYSSLARVDGLILHTEVGIGYETPWRQVEAMLLAAARRTTGLSADPRSFVLVKKLGDFAVTYELNASLDEIKTMNEVYTALHRNILDVFNEYGVQIMTPAYEGDPAQPKVVPPRNWYAEPAASPPELAVAASAPALGRTTVP